VILRPDASAWVINESSFVSLESAVMQGPSWAPIGTSALDELSTELPSIRLAIEDPGTRPLRDVEVDEPPKGAP
jgi:hypothetical protein